MPRRNKSGNDDFSNPYMTFPGGRALSSDISDARNSLMFGGDAGAPRASVPWMRNTTGDPNVQLFNNRTERGVATVDGRPIVESGMEISPGDTREQTFVYDPNERYFSIPHQAMDFSPDPRYQESPGFADSFDAYNRTFYGRGADSDPFSVGATSRQPNIGFSLISAGEMGNPSTWDFAHRPSILDLDSRIQAFDQDPGMRRASYFGDPTVQINPSGAEAYNPTGNTFDEISSGPYYQPNSSQFDEIPGSVYGEPTVQTPTAGNLDAEPSLFPQEQWWRDDIPGMASGGASAGAGGSIWSEAPELTVDGSAEFSGLPGPIGAEATGSLPDALFDPVSPGTGIGPEPTPIDPNYEWTTSPEDRRYLNTPEQTQQPDAPTGTVSGLDIRNFGVPRDAMNSNMSLGQFLNTSLSQMRYGEGYPSIPYGGRPDDLQPGEGYIDPQTQTGGQWVDSPGGQTFVEDNSFYPGTVGEPATEGEAVSPEVRRGQLVGATWPQVQSFLNANPRFNNPSAIRAIRAGANISQLVGRSQFDSHASSLMEMGRQAEGGSTGTRLPDEMMLASSFDQTTGDSLINPRGGGFRYSGNPHDPTGSFARQDWGTFNRNLSRLNANRGNGVRGLPVTGATGGGG